LQLYTKTFCNFLQKGLAKNMKKGEDKDRYVLVKAGEKEEKEG
jgi:hypothetical protein